MWEEETLTEVERGEWQTVSELRMSGSLVDGLGRSIKRTLILNIYVSVWLRNLIVVQ